MLTYIKMCMQAIEGVQWSVDGAGCNAMLYHAMMAAREGLLARLAEPGKVG